MGCFVRVAFKRLIRLHGLWTNHCYAALAALLTAIWPVDVHVAIGFRQRHIEPTLHIIFHQLLRTGQQQVCPLHGTFPSVLAALV